MGNDPLFSIAKQILFRFEPERAHDIALRFASTALAKSFLRRRYAAQSESIECMGLHFPNAVGLAAGLDKNGDYIDALGAMGFGFIEIGTVTPKPQSGNPKPRMFRLTRDEALINRLGFNNLGVDHLVERASKRRFTGVLGINIGKNASTPIEEAESDYLACLEKAYPVADYITVNVSSPNTEGLRDLQHGDLFRTLLSSLKNAQAKLAAQHGAYKPMVVKIAPDMSDADIATFCSAVVEHEIDGVIATNTTNRRDMLRQSELAGETGGLSGAPLYDLANQCLSTVAQHLDSKAALIGVGGVTCGIHALHKRQLGADLVQVYSGLIYHGPALIQDSIRKTA